MIPRVEAIFPWATHAVLSALAFNPTIFPVHAIDLEQSSYDRTLQRQIYSPLPQIQSYGQQLSDAQPIKTMRGIWQLREYDKHGKLLNSGSLTFRGPGGELAERGTVTYTGDGAAGRGPWILKPDGFGRSSTGMGAIIEKKAVWKLRRGSEGSYAFAGRVNVPSFTGIMPNAVVEGPIIKLINGGLPKGGTEVQVGRFQAELRQLLSAEDEEASVDSVAAGGAPESLQLVCVESQAIVSGIPQSCRDR